jgi:hypothetical protein
MAGRDLDPTTELSNWDVRRVLGLLRLVSQHNGVEKGPSKLLVVFFLD